MTKLFKHYMESVSESYPIIIYVDMDGVLADLHGGQEDFINNNYKEIYKEVTTLKVLNDKEKIEILKNIFTKKNDLVSDSEKNDIKSVYWRKFIEEKQFEKLQVLQQQVKILSDSLKSIKTKYPEVRIEILGSTGNPVNHYLVSEQKKKWLKSNHDKIDITFDKYNFVAGRKLKQNYAAKNTILIDDTISNCEEFKNAGGKSFHVHKNMNELTDKIENYIHKIKETI